MENYNLERFVLAHNNDYDTALNEIKNGKKISHWMWYIFPQIKGLGKTSISLHYAIQSLDEAKAYINHPILGEHLKEICKALIALNANNAHEIFGSPDDLKLKSSMTLFACATNDNKIFLDVLDKFYNGKLDGRTLSILKVK